MLSTNECQSPSALAVTVASGHAPARLHCGSRNLRQALGYNFALLAFGNALLKQHFQIKERLFLIRGGGEQSLLGIRTRRAAMTSRLWRCCSVTWGKGSGLDCCLSWSGVPEEATSRHLSARLGRPRRRGDGKSASRMPPGYRGYTRRQRQQRLRRRDRRPHPLLRQRPDQPRPAAGASRNRACLLNTGDVDSDVQLRPAGSHEVLSGQAAKTG